MSHDKKNTPSLLGKLRTAIKRVTFLMSFNTNRWRILSSMIAGGGSSSSRRLNFTTQLGLTAIISSSDDDDEDDNNWEFAGAPATPQQGELQKTRSFPVTRTVSFPEEEDVDKRAEMFIANFYRQLRMERQVSLNLRYKRDASFGSSNYSSP